MRLQKAAELQDGKVQSHVGGKVGYSDCPDLRELFETSHVATQDDEISRLVVVLVVAW